MIRCQAPRSATESDPRVYFFGMIERTLCGKDRLATSQILTAKGSLPDFDFLTPVGGPEYHRFALLAHMASARKVSSAPLKKGPF
jgi:hypothetical protein